MTTPHHPAKFSDKILRSIAGMLPSPTEGMTLLDPFAGTGRIHRLQSYGWTTIGIEIEPEWAEMHPATMVGDATALPFEDASIDAATTSPVYGNRMCLDPSTLITTWRGQIRIDSVLEGDLVLTGRCRWMPVTAVINSGLKRTGTLKVSGAPSIRCTSDHRILARDMERGTMTSPSWREAESLAPSDAKRFQFKYAATPTSTRDGVALPSRPTGSDAWWMIGFWLGNGTVRRRSTDGFPAEVSVSNDIRYAEETDARLGRLGFRRDATSSTPAMGVWVMADVDLASWLLATFGGSCYTKNIPGWCLDITHEERVALLDGYLAADGCARPNGSSIAVSVSMELLLGIKLVAASVGRSATLTSPPSKGDRIEWVAGNLSHCVQSWRLHVHNATSRKVHLDGDHAWTFVSGWDDDGVEVETYDIEVDGDHSFIANGIVVHNSDAHVQGEADKSTRNTYTHRMGRKLADNNAGAMQWGPKYKALHTKAWNELHRVLKPGAPFVLNIKNHIRSGSEIRVTEWHIEELKRIGFELETFERLPHRGNGYGENGDVRIPYESVIRFRRVA